MSKRKYTKRNKEYWSSKGQQTEGVVADGKNRTEEKTAEEILRIDALIGTSTSNPYKTTDKNILKRELESMGTAELQSLAMRVGVPPSNDKRQLKEHVLNTFDEYIRRHQMNVAQPPKPAIDPSDPAWEKVRKLMDQ